MKFREKNNTTIYAKLIKSKLFFIFLIPVFLALATGIFQNFYYRYSAQEDLSKLKAEIENLNKQKEELSKLIDYYRDESNLEKEARVRLNVKKEGEHAVIILPSATSTSESGESIFGAGGANMEDLPNYLQWRYYFFK